MKRYEIVFKLFLNLVLPYEDFIFMNNDNLIFETLDLVTARDFIPDI